MTSARGAPVGLAAPGLKVTRLELFYDLVFVFAAIHINAVAAKNLHFVSLVATFLLMAALWLVWSRFALLGNNLRADQGIMPIIGFMIMALVFVSVATLPNFGHQPPRPRPGVPQVIPGEFVFPTCYLLIWILEAVALRGGARLHPDLGRSWWKATPLLAASTVLLFLAAIVPRAVGRDAAAATIIAFWIGAVGIGYLTLLRTEPLTVVSAGHWAERYGQIILIALGESIISLGLGANLSTVTPLTVPVIGGALLGIALICALWWTYFDIRAYAAEQVMHRTHGADRSRLARDAYTLLHLPMVFGIILLSVGLKQTMAHLIVQTSEQGQTMLEPARLPVLYGGVLIYLLALLGFHLRTIGSVALGCALPIPLIGALLPFAHRLPAFAGLALLTTITILGIAVDAVRARGWRRGMRRRRLAEQRALEAEESRWRREHR
ncbi:low temperature requirement protein A [Plantactinospora sp. KBS50]|uniref:low temperature requirement protein A n=1 Tax=Plantactinospora sp. KBS50 TaxID=2024580 RepID=UPI0012FE698B|nr:low temperature requirement protein A [Plantactinospora sp. KBS50]